MDTNQFKACPGKLLRHSSQSTGKRHEQEATAGRTRENTTHTVTRLHIHMQAHTHIFKTVN